MKLKKRFKTIVITRKTVIVFLCATMLLIVGVITFKNEKKENENLYVSADSIYHTILSEQLNTDKENSHLIKKALIKLLGFDPEKPETILTNYSKNVKPKNIPDAKDYTYPGPKKTQAPQNKDTAEEKPIEEISVAKGMSISNSTDIKVNLNELISKDLKYSINSDGPQILIVHTHTTESYTDSGKTKYTAQDKDRSTDETKNITAVGKVLYDTLKEKGIEAIHDTTVHDYPSYNGAYNRSKATVIKNLEKYPSIKLVLDVHRDGIVRSDGTKIKVACDINGEKTAQCMFVVGSNVSLTHDNWQENMKLAAKLQNKANQMYPGLMRPINLREERFNQQLSLGALIIEVGSNGNTLNEAKNSARIMGNVVAALFGK